MKAPFAAAPAPTERATDAAELRSVAASLCRHGPHGVAKRAVDLAWELGVDGSQGRAELAKTARVNARIVIGQRRQMKTPTRPVELLTVNERGKEKTMGDTMGDAPAAAVPALSALVGTWTTEATHQMYPDMVVRGRAVFEWLEGERFLIARARVDHPKIPDSISIIGHTDGLRMHYFDSRGVPRIYEASISDDSWKLWRDEPEFSQRVTHTFEDDGSTIVGLSQLSRDGATRDDDLEITYRRER